MKRETLKKFPVFFFSIGVLLNCLFFTRTVLDYTLVPRFVFFSFFILIFFFFLLFFFKNLRFSVDLVILPFFLYTLFSLTSIFWSINTSLAIIESSKMFLYFFFLILTCNLLQYYKEELFTKLLKTIILLFFISSLQVLPQILELPEISRIYLYKLSGTSGHKNLFSSFLFLCSIFSYLGLFHLKSYWKFISGFAIIGQLILIIILQTRAVWIGYSVFLFSGLFLFFLQKKVNSVNQKYLIVFAAFLLISANLFFIFGLPRLISIYNERRPASYDIEKVTDLNTVSERALVWEKTYKVFAKNPLGGCGANNWQICFPASSLPDIYPVKDLNVTFQRPHNDFLWILSEYGIIGFNLFLLFIITVLFLLFSRIFSHYEISGVIILSGLLGYLSVSFFDFPKERIEHNILFSILLSVSYYFIKKEPYKITAELFSIPKYVLKSSLLILVVILYFSLLNFKGEYFTKKMFAERIKNNHRDIIGFCDKARSFCYTVDPTSVPLSWYRGNAEANLGNYSAALRDFKNAFGSHPFNHYVLNDLGSSYFNNNLIDSAKIFYMESARINPRFDEPKLNLTAIYINEGNIKEAQKWNESLFHDSERRSYYRGLINGNGLPRSRAERNSFD